MSLSVLSSHWGYLPVICLAMSFHLFPYSLCVSKSIASSSIVQFFLLTVGIKWLYHLSRHCLPVRADCLQSPLRFSAINVQSVTPNLSTNFFNPLSSYTITPPLPQYSSSVDSWPGKLNYNIIGRFLSQNPPNRTMNRNHSSRIEFFCKEEAIKTLKKE